MNAKKLKSVLAAHQKWLSGEGGKRADLANADLRGADLRDAVFRGADLRGANLRSAVLCGADFCGADFRGAVLCGADLVGADLSGATLNWSSHELLAEVLRQAAGQLPARRMLAGLVLVSRDWCWRDFVRLECPERAWACAVLREYVTDETPVEVAELLGARTI